MPLLCFEDMQEESRLEQLGNGVVLVNFLDTTLGWLSGDASFVTEDRTNVPPQDRIFSQLRGKDKSCSLQ